MLGIETSCDDTGVALVEDGHRILAEATSRQDDLHARFGGVVPEVASRCHAERLAPLTQAILQEAGLTFSDVDGIAYTEGPGLIGSLLVGVNFGKALAYRLAIPAVGIHHLEAHLYSTRFAESEIIFPHLALLVSGGHTSLYIVKEWNRVEVVGQTLDDAAGEAFDKVAKLLGLGYPGGPAVAQAADKAQGPLPELPLPRTKGEFDFSLSGLKSAVARLVERGDYPAADVAAAFQDVVVTLLVSRVMEAAARFELRQVTLCGGVAANRCLRLRLQQRCEERSLSFVAAPFTLAMDNGVMVAGLGYHYLNAGCRSPLQAGAFSTSRLGYA